MDRRETLPDLKPLVSAKAIEKSGRVLKAFSLFYFPFHNLKSTDIFENYGSYALISALVYQADELNERTKTKSSSLNSLTEFMLRRGLINKWTQQYIDEGERYLASEQKFRSTGLNNLQEVVSTMQLRSFDFRILHCALFQFLLKPIDLIVFDAFAAFEMLMEFDDDLLSYEEDIEANTFNFIRALSLLPEFDGTKTVSEFRRNILQRIQEYKSLMKEDVAAKYKYIIDTYSVIVPRPEIPSVFLG